MIKSVRWVIDLGKQLFSSFGKIAEKIAQYADGAFKAVGTGFSKLLDFIKGLMKWGDEVPEGALGKADDAADVSKGQPNKKDVPKTKDDITNGKTSNEKKLEKNKTKGVNENQLSEVGKNYPVPLTPEEFARVNFWQNARNKYLKKWRDMDFSRYSEETREFLKKTPNPDNAIRKSMAPDDLAGALKEKRGIKILDKETGKILDHIQEVEQSVDAITNKIKKIERLLKEMYTKDPTSPDIEILQEKLNDLSKIKKDFIYSYNSK